MNKKDHKMISLTVVRSKIWFNLFEAHFVAGKEWNAQCCAYVGHRKVVDLVI